MLKWYGGDVAKTTKFMDLNDEALIIRRYMNWIRDDIRPRLEPEQALLFQGLCASLIMDRDKLGNELMETGIRDLVRNLDGTYDVETDTGDWMDNVTMDCSEFSGDGSTYSIDIIEEPGEDAEPLSKAEAERKANRWLEKFKTSTMSGTAVEDNSGLSDVTSILVDESRRSPAPDSEMPERKRQRCWSH